jgi:hypothetical protein
MTSNAPAASFVLDDIELLYSRHHALCSPSALIIKMHCSKSWMTMNLLPIANFRSCQRKAVLHMRIQESDEKIIVYSLTL